MAVPTYWSYDHFPLPLPARHRYPRGRFRAVRETLEAQGLLPPHRLRAAAREGWEGLALAHDEAYLRDVREGTLSPQAMREIGIPWSTALVDRARAAVFATRQAAEQALIDGAGAVIGGGTHHAFADRGAGYCLFNDIAVAVRALQQAHQVHRVLIVDLDVHQGNGSAAIFARDRNVFTFSVHGANNWPYRKTNGDIDLALPDGTGDEDYLAAIEAPLHDTLDRFRPDLVFYQAGADPLHSDRLGRLALTHEGLRSRDRMVLRACADRLVPVTLTLGGGYGVPMEDTIQVHLGTLEVFERIYGEEEENP